MLSRNERLVWTAPVNARAKLSSGAAVWCGHVSGLLMRRMAAGPDAIRGLAPDQFRAFRDARPSTGSGGPRVRPMSHHATSALTRPPVVATSSGKLVAREERDFSARRAVVEAASLRVR